MEKLQISINKSIVKIIGLFEEPAKIDSILTNNNYKQKIVNENEESFLRDYFYIDFRDLMFMDHEKVNNRSYKKTINKEISFKENEDIKEIEVADSEIYLFGKDYIAIFCLSINLKSTNNIIHNYSSFLNIIRQFDSELSTGLKWYEWIQNEVLCSINIRGKEVNVNEYSGSKFKLFTVLDINKEIDIEKRKNMLFEIGTTSPYGSSSDPSSIFYPHPDYFSNVMENRVSVFNNWESLALFDSFTTIGLNILDKDYKVETWNEIYLKIYLFRLFFKFNLFRFNKKLSYTVKSMKTRTQYEEFLNIFNVKPISYNFLPNKMFEKIGHALEIDTELLDFHTRITRISDNIKEKKQTNMNLLLEFISVVSAAGIIELVFGIVEILNKSKGPVVFILYFFMLLISVFIIHIVVRFIKINLK